LDRNYRSAPEEQNIYPDPLGTKSGGIIFYGPNSTGDTISNNQIQSYGNMINQTKSLNYDFKNITV